MAKIFISFYNGIKNSDKPYGMPIFYESFIKGLNDNGNDVFVLMHSNWQANFGTIPTNLLNEIKNFNPDVIFLFNNSFYDLTPYFDCPIVVYEVDSPLYYKNIEHIKSNPTRYKFFVAASTSADIIHNEFKVPKENIIQVPFFTEVKSENTKNLYNISFIGSKFRGSYKNFYNKFMETAPTEDERKEFLNLISKLEENPFLTKEELFKDVNSEKIKQTFDPYEAVFLLSDYKRINILSNVADLGLNIWGNDSWAKDTYNNHELILRYHPEPVFSLADNQFIYNSSKIGINIGHIQAKNGFPWRVFDVMASNACLVTEYHGDFKKYFPKLELPYFSNGWEAREQCKKLLENENYRLDIVHQAQEIVDKNYRFNNILGIIEDYLEINMHDNSKTKDCRLTKLDEWVTPDSPSKKTAKNKKPKTLKDKLRYKIWSHYDKILKKKGMI